MLSLAKMLVAGPPELQHATCDDGVFSSNFILALMVAIACATKLVVFLLVTL